MLKLVDGVLELVIQHGTVRHHDHRVELLLALLIMQPRKLVGGPGNGVRFTGARAVLNEILIASAFYRRSDNQFVHDIPLMITREDQALFLALKAIPLFFLFDL